MKYSIVAVAWNRKIQAYNTMLSIEHLYKNYDYEVIIVDDASSSEQGIRGLEKKFNHTKVIEISEEDKGQRINPCIPFNIGIEQAQGDVIILQSAEIFHVKNSLEYIEKNLTSDNYLTFGCFYMNPEWQNKLNHSLEVFKNNASQDFTTCILNNVGDLPEVSIHATQSYGWCNHSIHADGGYHWLSAITSDNLKNKLRGFDERYAAGTCYDDNEILHRIKKFLSVHLIDGPWCFHQYHAKHSRLSGSTDAINRKLFHNLLNEGDGWDKQITRL